MFDRAEIRVRAGNGGDGSVSFRKEKHVPFGGPDGGDGGDGGDVIFVADRNLTSLRRFKRGGCYKAEHGGDGRSQKKYGKKGKALVLAVPLGTVVLPGVSLGEDAPLADLEQPEQRVVILKGGKGGRGNIHFTSSTNQAPRLAEKGEAGQEMPLVLELRLIADVGIIGYPNVGKSSLLAAASAAKPKIAGYPFTTLEPILGMVEVDMDGFVLAEIPGLIADAHLGKGLGHDFLRHVTRTKMLLHLVDGGEEEPVEGMVRVNTELSMYDSALAKKPQIVAVNKVDLPEVRDRMDDIAKAFGEVGITPLFVSAASGEGVPELMAELMKRLSALTVAEKTGESKAAKVFRPRPAGARVRLDDGVFIITEPHLERIAARMDSPSLEVLWQFRAQLIKTGVDKALRKAGVKPGDKVRCGKLEMEW